MKFAIFSLFITAAAFASNTHTNRLTKGIPNLDLETTSQEYQKLMVQSFRADGIEDTTATDPEDAEIARWIAIGVKNLQWVNLVNANRTAGNKISLSSQATQGGSPVNTPSTYNFAIVKERWQILESLLPAPLKAVIFGNAPITAAVPVTDREFIEWLVQVDRAYQTAARYSMMKPWKLELAARAVKDVRGYVHISGDASIDQKLSSFATLSSSQKAQITTDLSQICWNDNGDKEGCDKELTAAIQANQLNNFKNKYIEAGRKNYQDFFDIPVSRTDITWNSQNPNVLEIPFTNPKNENVLNYLQTNIQDEWKWKGWQLHLNFVDSQDPDTTHVVFQPGSTPHVNELAGSEITMDANAPLSEYDVQWTIRHEYGHVLGFPDCYFEFYDEAVEAYVSYQLDVTNLMCSRRGHLQQIHFDELKKTYFKP